jgi:hypothetical protein
VRGTALVTLFVVAGAAAGASPAQAAVTVGETATSTNEACDGAGNNTVQVGVAAGHNSFAAPSGGVITSWSHNARSTSDGTVLKLKVYRAQGSSFLAVGESEFQDVSDAGPRTFATRVVVAAGDVLGLGLGANADTHPASCFQPNGTTGDDYRNRVGDLVTGTAGTFPGGPFQVRANVAAQLEPDRDCDGLGDESQDPAVGTCGSAQGGGGTGKPLSPPRDTTRPRLRKAKAKASAKRTSVSVAVTPSEACTLSAGAKVAVGNTAAKSVIRLAPVKKKAKAGKAVRLTLKVRRKDRARLRRALRRKGRKVKISIKATDAAGNITRTSASVKLKRL